MTGPHIPTYEETLRERIGQLEAALEALGAAWRAEAHAMRQRAMALHDAEAHGRAQAAEAQASVLERCANDIIALCIVTGDAVRVAEERARDVA